MNTSCPDGIHEWKVNTYPDPETSLYPATCKRCGLTKQFTSRMPDEETPHRRKPVEPMEMKPSKRGINFKNPAAMQAKHDEYEKLKPHIISTYVEKGTIYGTSVALRIPQSSLRRLLNRWKKEIDKAIRQRDKQKKEEGAVAADIQPDTNTGLSGEIVSLIIDDNKIVATVKFEVATMKNLHLGAAQVLLSKKTW